MRKNETINLDQPHGNADKKTSQPQNSGILALISKKYGALAFSALIGLQACTPANQQNKFDVLSVFDNDNFNLKSINSEIIAMKQLAQSDRFPTRIITKLEEALSGRNSREITARQSQIIGRIRIMAEKIHLILKRGNNEQKKYANSMLNLLIISLSTGSLFGNLEQNYNSLVSAVEQNPLLDSYFASIGNGENGRSLSGQIKKDERSPIKDNLIHPKTESRPEDNKQEPKLQITPLNPIKKEEKPQQPVIVPEIPKINIIKKTDIVVRLAPNPAPATEFIPLPEFSALWENADQNIYSRRLKREIIISYKLEHRWKQLNFLLQKSGLNEVLYYLMQGTSKPNKRRLTQFLFGNFKSGKSDTEMLSRLKEFIEFAEKNKLQNEQKEVPSLANISGSLAKLENKIDLGVAANPDHMMVVDVSQQLLYIVARQGKGRYTIESTHSVSTGRRGTYEKTGKIINGKTPIGPMRVIARWGGSKPINQVFDGGWTKKRVPIEVTRSRRTAVMMGRLLPLQSLDRRTPIEGIFLHTTNKKLFLGQRASHGCIRLGNVSILDVYNAGPKDTLVFIQY